MKTHISFSLEDRVGRALLSGRESGNRLGTEDLRQLAEGLEELAGEGPAVIVLEGSDADFCLGRDPGGDSDPAAARESLAMVLDLGDRIRTLPVLVLAAVQGRARGLGAGLVLHADLALAEAGATLAFDEVERGFPPTLVMTYVERYLPRKLAREMVATGRSLSAADALGLGLLNGVAASGELPAAAAALSAELASRDPRALGACKPFLAEMEWLPPNQRAARGIEAGVEFFSRAHGAASSSANNDENGGKETR